VTFIANDWHAALLPVFLRSRYQEGGAYRGATCALAIHNLAHQVRNFSCVRACMRVCVRECARLLMKVKA
jgi:hypothetical protein